MWKKSTTKMHFSFFRIYIPGDQMIKMMITCVFTVNCVCSVNFHSKQLVFHFHKSSNTIKVSFVEMSFAKIKLLRFNLHAIVFHT